MAILEDGKKAQTTIISLKSNGKLSLIEAKPYTGRTHQIRVHLKAIGHPILGDSLYGIAKMNLEYSEEKQLLHAYKIAFIHPFSKEAVCIEAPIPFSIKNWEEKL
jgi:23S rRNA pseudouridine1911/1915/1917 synthase